MLIDSREPVPNVHLGARTLAQFGENVYIDEEAFHKATRRPKRRGRTKSESRPTSGIPPSYDHTTSAPSKGYSAIGT
jgi:hypothetical protein